jgi:hypothetical protein
MHLLDTGTRLAKAGHARPYVSIHLSGSSSIPRSSIGDRGSLEVGKKSDVTPLDIMRPG